ncbi:Cytochrome c biogenesis protein CcsA [Streptomyces griseoloalbus]
MRFSGRAGAHGGVRKIPRTGMRNFSHECRQPRPPALEPSRAEPVPRRPCRARPPPCRPGRRRRRGRTAPDRVRFRGHLRRWRRHRLRHRHDRVRLGPAVQVRGQQDRRRGRRLLQHAHPVRRLQVRQPLHQRRPGAISWSACPRRPRWTSSPTASTPPCSPLSTSPIIAGAIWAGDAWGRYWGWDPKETWSFITWVAYAGYLHARATAGWKGRKAAYLALLAFACWLFNYYGVNIFVNGKHSYLLGRLGAGGMGRVLSRRPRGPLRGGQAGAALGRRGGPGLPAPLRARAGQPLRLPSRAARARCFAGHRAPHPPSFAAAYVPRHHPARGRGLHLPPTLCAAAARSRAGLAAVHAPGHGAPRPEAVQRDADPGRPHPHRLRRGPRRRPEPAHQDRHGRGHARLHVARTGLRQAGVEQHASTSSRCRAP